MTMQSTGATGLPPRAATDPRLNVGSDDIERSRHGRIDWGAVIAGVAMLVAVTLILNLLGVGIGITATEPLQPGETPSATAFGIGAGIWWVVSNWIAVGVGAFIAGRVAHRLLDVDGGLHGLVVWAIGLILTMTMFASIAGSIASGVTSTIGMGVQTAAQSDNRSLVDRLTAPANQQTDLEAELRRFIANPESVDRNRIVDVIAREAGVDRTEAERRLAQAETEARQAADTAATVLGQTAIWGVVALLIGAVAGYFGGRWGAQSARTATRRSTTA